jgi:hypothetical protein
MRTSTHRTQKSRCVPVRISKIEMRTNTHLSIFPFPPFGYVPSRTLVGIVVLAAHFDTFHDGLFCTRATKEGENVKPAVIPSKSHSAAVLIILRQKS